MARRTAVVARAVRSVSPELAALSDRDLLKRFADDGEQAAFAAVVSRHTAMVLGVCKRVLHSPADAEDATQAVFLVLAKKAKSTRWQASVANWLYTTARKVAHNARLAAERRSKRERSAAVPEATSPADTMSGRELIAALDDELDRLTTRYREPLVLCYLEGLTRDEAAARLNLAVPALNKQLERGRKKLADALAARGCTLGVLLLAAASTSSAGASPPLLHESILAAAAAGGSPSESVAALAQGVVMNGIFTRTRLAVLAVIGLTAVGFGLTAVPLAAQPPKTERPKADVKKGDEKAKERTVSGTVVGPDGQPVEGVKVWACHSGGYFSSKLPAPKHVATTDKEGRFVATSKDGEDPLTWATLAATKDGHGPGFARPTDGRCSLALVKDDIAVEGRVLDLQGKPATGATVRVLALHRSDAADLTAWEKTARTSTREAAGRFREFFPHSVVLEGGPLGHLPAEVMTDKDGRFSLSGLGRDRLVKLRVSGNGVATTSFDAVTRDVKTIRTPDDKLESQYIPHTYHGTKFDLTVEPSQPFVGVVTDKQTGKPVPSVRVQPVRGWYEGVSAVTDADGKYRLEGLRTGEHELVAVPPVDQPYHLYTFKAGRPANQKPVTADVELHRGVWVSGTVTDKATGKPVAATVAYRPDGFDPAADAIPGYLPRGLHESSNAMTDAAGKFRVLAAPGAGYVLIRAWGGRYLSGDQIDWQGDVEKAAPLTFVSSAPVEIASNWNAVGGVTVADGKPAKEYAFSVDPGKSVTARTTDADGKPLSGAVVTQRTNFGIFEVDTLTSADVTFEQVNPKRPRTVLILHPEKRLGTAYRPGADKETDIRLSPTGTANGRLVSEEGTPLADTPIEVRYGFDGEMGRRATELHPQVKTDKDGRFTIPNLIAGVKYELRWPRPAPKRANGYLGFTVKSGEEKDLGDVGRKEDRE